MRNALPEAIEILLRSRAFVCKKVSDPSSRHLKKGQVTWSRYDSVSAAWDAAKEQSGFDVELC